MSRVSRTDRFDRVIEALGPTVWRVCRAVAGPDDADDAWSETFLAALRAWPDLPPETDVEAWLVTVAHRKALDQVRRRTRHAEPVETLPERPAARGNPHDHDPDLWTALARLTERQRLAVAHHHLAGRPHPEVAALLGCTPAAARRASADGIAALRRTYPLPWLVGAGDQDPTPRPDVTRASTRQATAAAGAVPDSAPPSRRGTPRAGTRSAAPRARMRHAGAAPAPAPPPEDTTTPSTEEDQ